MIIGSIYRFGRDYHHGAGGHNEQQVGVHYLGGQIVHPT